MLRAPIHPGEHSVRVIRDLNPVVHLNGRTFVVLTPEIAAVPWTCC